MDAGEVPVDSAEKFVVPGFNSFTPSLHFNGVQKKDWFRHPS